MNNNEHLRQEMSSSDSSILQTRSLGNTWKPMIEDFSSFSDISTLPQLSDTSSTEDLLEADNPFGSCQLTGPELQKILIVFFEACSMNLEKEKLKECVSNNTCIRNLYISTSANIGIPLSQSWGNEYSDKFDLFVISKIIIRFHNLALMSSMIFNLVWTSRHFCLN